MGGGDVAAAGAAGAAGGGRLDVETPPHSGVAPGTGHAPEAAAATPTGGWVPIKGGTNDGTAMPPDAASHAA